ncbi:hypothetical protein GOARA_068_01000 [Gordonia araii NBRC 100433]|uniref:DUF1023 domain-containing protein n=1 Tax=Gordonia araii NBRC 100433 TaxID=1073574 RepID=G7H6G4_9ACTN|nr:alpha/beta hydrolase [Gordonia araii]NNG96119.1 hypothetical protein [Gordonia araii NBRC 100433]GAB11439.1 hypothetical protein GOARA_068_01000 [Gordonia araii NBRC 100433]
MLTVEQVAGWPPRPLDEAARQARANGRTLRAEVRGAQAKLRALRRWHGVAARAAARRVAQEVDHADEVARVLCAFADAAQDAGADLARGRDRVLRLAAEQGSERVDARRRGVDAPGERTEPDDRVRSALAELDETDRRRATELSRLAGELAAMKAGHVAVATPQGPRDPDDVVNRLVAMTPDQQREFLARMSPADIDRLIIANPQAMGNLEAVAFPARMAANRRAIEEALEAEIRRGAGDQARATELRSMLGTIPDPHEPGRRVRRRFVSFANTPNGRSVEMFGELHPATRGVGVYVPGTGTTMDGAASNRAAAWQLAHRSGAPVFLFMDGDFPPDLANALSPRFATSMAPSLVGFGRALDAEIAAHAPGAATTYIGHSYGGAVVGTAEQLGLRADRVVYASASGTGVLPGGADAWTNPADPHRFSITAPGDPIHPFQASGRHGGDPDATPGVVRMDTGDFSDGRRVRGAAGHGDYFDDPGSDAFKNLVAVIMGEPVTPYVDREADGPLVPRPPR